MGPNDVLPFSSPSRRESAKAAAGLRHMEVDRGAELRSHRSFAVQSAAEHTTNYSRTSRRVDLPGADHVGVAADSRRRDKCRGPFEKGPQGDIA